MRKKKCSDAESCHDGLSNPRPEELVKSVFLHLCFIILFRVTMEGQQEPDRGDISQQRYKESKNAEINEIRDF